MRRQVEEMMISSISEYQLIILGVPRILTLIHMNTFTCRVLLRNCFQSEDVDKKPVKENLGNGQTCV